MTALMVRLLLTAAAAFAAGRLAVKMRLPAILGWLIAGMALGPHAFGLMNQTLMQAQWYQTLMHCAECAVGLLIGTELVWRKLKKTGAQILVTTLTQSLGTFFLVSLVFAVVFYVQEVPLYLAVIFGGVALATAPAPALSIVREFHTAGPVTDTLIPMAALDDMVAVIVFFSSISVISAGLSAQQTPAYMILLIVLLPILVGAVMGVPAGWALRKPRPAVATTALLATLVLASAAIGFFMDYRVLPRPALNFMLIGMAFSTVFANMVSQARLEEIMRGFQPVLGVCLIVVILNLGAPLDYHLILGAGIYTAVYILARACGKCGGAYLGARLTKSPKTVQKYLGLTLLPHSGVSLVFTGIAASVLAGPAPECASIIQGTIAAAAVINEVIAVIAAKKAFEWAGESGGAIKKSGP